MDYKPPVVIDNGTGCAAPSFPALSHAAVQLISDAGCVDCPSLSLGNCVAALVAVTGTPRWGTRATWSRSTSCPPPSQSAPSRPAAPTDRAYPISTSTSVTTQPLQRERVNAICGKDLLIGVACVCDFAGDAALNNSSTYTVNYPIRHGLIENWDNMERLWQRCLFQYLRLVM